jgi:hypothetical protein
MPRLSELKTFSILFHTAAKMDISQLEPLYAMAGRIALMVLCWQRRL